jgi:hypothetical protein
MPVGQFLKKVIVPTGPVITSRAVKPAQGYYGSKWYTLNYYIFRIILPALSNYKPFLAHYPDIIKGGFYKHDILPSKNGGTN